MIDEECDYILDLGIEFVGGKRIDSLKALLAEDFDAIFVGCGAPRGRDLDIPGRKEAAKPTSTSASTGCPASRSATSTKIGKRVIVLGGGNTAMDCCRSSRRLGGEDVKVVVRSGFEEMKASPWEKEDAMHEDIPILNYPRAEGIHPRQRQAHRRRVREGQGGARRQGPPQARADRRARPALPLRRRAGRGRPGERVPLDRARHRHRVRQMGHAQGRSDDHGVDQSEGVLRRRRRVRPEEHHLGGGARPRGRDLDRPASAAARTSTTARRRMVAVISQKMGIHEWSYDNEIALDKRYRVPHRDKVVALRDIKAEVELGYDVELALKEAERCLNCDVQTVFTGQLCIECDACVDICPMDCITFTAERRGSRPAHAAAGAGEEPHPGPLRRQQPQDRPRHGEGRGRVPALRAVRRALPDRRLGHAEIPHRYDSRGTSMPIQSVNDFVVRFANVNGSGSASANELFARAVLRMGMPVAPRNIFPSNIQGLPTWYEVRISEAGHLGARGGTDLMVAMNPQTWDKDVAGIEPGGYLLYDSTKPMPKSKFRDDITVIGVPLTAICNREYTDPRQRQLFKNIIYVGALSALLDMDVAEIEKLIGEQFKGKEKLFDANKHALHLGRDWATDEPRMPDRAAAASAPTRSATASSSKAIPPRRSARSMAAPRSAPGIRSRPRPRSPRPSRAIASGCASIRETKKNKFAIVQAEDELASIGIVIGAAWNGARAFTATSGPGISLMQEFLGLAYFAEIPAVMFDVQRAGPSTGMPTRTQQSDIISCAYASHGDTKHVLLFPEDPAEAFEFGAAAFDLADRLQTPVFVMLDLDIGMNHRLCRPLTWDDSRKLRPRQGDDRGRRSKPARISAAISTSTATAFPTAPIRARIRPRARSSPAAPRATATRATPRKARPTPTTCSGCCASSRPPRIWCRGRCRPMPTSRPNTA